MCLAIMASVSQLICVKEWRKPTNTFDAPIFLENKISLSLTAVCVHVITSLYIIKYLLNKLTAYV
jgi:hypothetical protein